MVTEVDLPVEERLFQLFQHLGIEQAHVAGLLPQDWSGLVTAHPGVIASLTLICPVEIDPGTLRPLAQRLLVFAGDQGPLAEMVNRAMAALPEAVRVSLRGGVIQGWTDVVADWTEEIGATLVDFLERMDQQQGVRPALLPEMVRVTKPGGRVAVIVRAVDLPWVVDLSLRAELKAKVEAPWGPVGERGCADASLYRRFREVGLTGVKRFPQLATFDSSIESKGMVPLLIALMAPMLGPEEAGEFRAAVAQAQAEGTLLVAQPHHCAVGIKPERSTRA